MKPGNDDGEPYIICGKEVDKNDFKKAYQALVGILYTERIDESAVGEPYVTVNYKYKDGRNEKVKYYEYDERNVIAIKSDNTAVKVLKSEIDRFLALIEELA